MRVNNTLNNQRSKYVFGFNGQEKVNEIAGIGNHNTALFWEYDTRLGRRWNVDPVIKPHRSPYDAFDNSPIWKVDPDGDDDYYNKAGKFIGSDGKGTAIRLMDNKNIQDAKSFNATLAIAKNLKIDVTKARDNVSRVITFDHSKGVIKKLYSDAKSDGKERIGFIVLDVKNAKVDIRPYETKNNSATHITTPYRSGDEYKGEAGTVILGNIHTHQEEANYLGKKTLSGKTVTDQLIFDEQYSAPDSDGNISKTDGSTYTIGVNNIDFHSSQGKSDSKNNLTTKEDAEQGKFNIPQHAIQQSK